MNNDSKLEIAYKYCKPLKVACIKNELETQLEGYIFQCIERENDKWIVCFENFSRGRAYLTISLDSFWVLKTTTNGIERINLDENLLLTHRLLDKRENGVVYSIIQKQFAYSSRFKQFVLTDLVEQRFTLTRDKINSLPDNVDFDNTRLAPLFLKLRMLEDKIDLKGESNYYSKFSTHMNYNSDLEGSRKIRDNIHSTRTYLNDEEVLNIFNIDGPDKIYRIYDLYNGIINPRNARDINSINLGFLSPDAFNYKELKGINEQENSLVGESLVKVSDTYVNYLREFFDQKFGYKGRIELDRDSMLLGITHQMSGTERTKREIERKLGIPYSEFELLDFDEQQKLIEQKTGKNFKYDYRLYIDGIPMDEEHIITIDQIDRQIDELTSSSPKKFIKRLLRTFKKR